MHVPMPFVPSISSGHTPPSQVPQYSKECACPSSPRCSTATPERLQNKTTYPASRTTLYNWSISCWALKMSLSSSPRKCFSSPDVRMHGALLSAGSTPCLVADLCQELDTSSTPGRGAAPSATEQTYSACPAKVPSKAEDRSESRITHLVHDGHARRRTGAVEFPRVLQAERPARTRCRRSSNSTHLMRALSKR